MDFKNTVVIMTSNVGSNGFRTRRSTMRRSKNRSMEVLRATFKPEFLNRIDDIIMFSALKLEDIHKIVDIQLGLDR